MTRHINKLFLLLGLIVTFLVYRPGLEGYFQFDDFVNLLENPDIKIDSINTVSLLKAWGSGFSGPLGRPLSMLSFGLNYYFHQFDPYYFKLVNVFIHLANGLVIYLIIDTLFSFKGRFYLEKRKSQTLALIVSLLWLLHPLNVSGVLYVVQRMNQLSCFFTLLGVYFYTKFRSHDKPYSIVWIVISFASFGFLACLSKENGILLAPILLLIESTFFSFSSSRKSSYISLVALFILTTALPLILFTIYALTNPEFITKAYELRQFDLSQRLLTESRILWFYISQILLPNTQNFGFYHDDIALSTSFFDPATTAIAVFSIVLLALASSYQIIKRPSIWAFGIIFFLVGHSLESSVFGLEIAYEHRNYLPSVGLLLIPSYYLFDYFHAEGGRKIIFTTFILFFSYCSWTTFNRAQEWGNPGLSKILEAQRHPDSARANLEAGYYYTYLNSESQVEASRNYKLAYEHFTKASELAKYETFGLIGLIILHGRYGIPIEESWEEILLKRLKEKPLTTSSLASITSLHNCFYSKDCNISNDLFKKILIAAIENKATSTMANVKLRLFLAIYVSSIEKDSELGGSMLVAASKLTNDPIFKLEIAKSALIMNKPKITLQILNEIKNTVSSISIRRTVINLEQDAVLKINKGATKQ